MLPGMVCPYQAQTTICTLVGASFVAWFALKMHPGGRGLGHSPWWVVSFGQGKGILFCVGTPKEGAARGNRLRIFIVWHLSRIDANSLNVIVFSLSSNSDQGLFVDDGYISLVSSWNIKLRPPGSHPQRPLIVRSDLLPAMSWQLWGDCCTYTPLLIPLIPI